MRFSLLVLFCFVSCRILAMTPLKTEALSSDIHTIQVNADGDWQRLPVIDLGGDDFIRVNFDRLGENAANQLRYRVVRCDADWSLSSLSPIEFLDGFNDTDIEDYAYSVNASVEYVNYNIQIPNDRLKLKLSGNYAVEVYEEGDASRVLLRACFSLLDSRVMMVGEVSSVTDIDANKEHQQLSFKVDYNNLQVRDPFSDIIVYVRQNNRQDNERAKIKPTYIQSNKLIYEHNRDLIFEAGNEYRRFESVSYRYNGLNMEHTFFRNPYYYAYILPDKVKAEKVYTYDQDQNGRFVIRNSESASAESDVDADYFMTTFRLKADHPFLEPIYINGDFTGDVFDDRYLMKYDPVEGEYSQTLLLKQGAYNYQYLAKLGNNYSPSLVEGNYFETENEYSVMVYYRPLGSRTDLLVGRLVVKSK